MYEYRIQEFYGVQQQKDGALLPLGSARDCRNVETFDGNLSVARGFQKHILAAVPGTDRILKLIAARGTTDKFYVVTAGKVYACVSGAWTAVYTFPSALTTDQVCALQTQIGNDDYLALATGDGQMVKIKLSDNSADVFGTGAFSFDGTVSQYDADTKVVTLSAALSAEALRHAPLDGITIADQWLAVASAAGSMVTLKDAPETAPASADTATIRGGGSDAHCKFLDLYYGRLFSAGDPDAPCRLYWSAVPGSGRTFEDWLAVTGSADASGGYVEVGDASGDPIIGIKALATELLIVKRYSVYRLRGDRPSTYAVERVESFSENMSNASFIVKYNVPYYLTKTGIKQYDGVGVLPVNNGIRYLRTFIDSLHGVGISKGVHQDNVLYFTCCTSAASTYDDAMIVYDIARDSYTLRDGFQIADLVQHDGHLYMINDNRYVYEFNKGTDYDGEHIAAYWETQDTDLNNKLSKKQITDVLARGTSGFVVIKIASGDNVWTGRKQLLTQEKGFVRISINADRASSFHIRIENEAGSAFSLCGGVELLFQKEIRN